MVNPKQQTMPSLWESSIFGDDSDFGRYLGVKHETCAVLWLASLMSQGCEHR